jgi:hypothetical protein
MALNFPNLSRSYDPERRRIRFLTESAFHRLSSNPECTEATMLATFDANRDRINAVANRIHAFGRQDFHILEADDFP